MARSTFAAASSFWPQVRRNHSVAAVVTTRARGSRLNTSSCDSGRSPSWMGTLASTWLWMYRETSNSSARVAVVGSLVPNDETRLYRAAVVNAVAMPGSCSITSATDATRAWMPVFRASATSASVRNGLGASFSIMRVSPPGQLLPQ
jgi:hypothetical protein